MNSSIDRPTIEQVLSRHYPIEIHFIAEDDESGYYFRLSSRLWSFCL